MSTSLPFNFEEAFQIAREKFLKNLKRPHEHDLSRYTSIDDVYEYTEKLQKEQARNGNMRHLNRISPYLQNLEQYVGILDTFSQVKADLLSLIWVRTVIESWKISLLIRLTSLGTYQISDTGKTVNSSLRNL
jgi:hypothetical protein